MSHARTPRRTSTVATALAANRLGTPAVSYFVMSAAAPLAAVALVVITGYSVTGQIGIPVGFVVMGMLLALFCVGFVTMAPYVANAGAFNAYVSRGLTRPLGVAAGWVSLIAYNASQVGLYGGLGDAATPLLHSWFGLDLPWWVVALAGWALVAFLGLQNIDLNGRVLAVLLAAEVGVVVLYSLANLAHPAGGTVTVATLNPSNMINPHVGALLAVAMLGFVGFEGAVVFSEEARNPGRTVRVATFLSLGILTVLYALSSWAMSVATGPGQIVQEASTHSTDLIFTLARSSLGTMFVDLGRALYVTSVLATLIAFHNTAARYMFALGRERMLPAALGRTSRRTSSPKAGSMVQSAIGLTVIVIYALAGLDPVIQLFFWCTTSGSLGILLLIATTSIAVIGFFARHPSGENVWRRAVAPVLAAIGVITVVALVLVNFASLLGVDENSPLRWGIPGVYLVVAVCGVVWGLTLRATRPQVYANIGLGAKSATGTGLNLGAPEDFDAATR